jgi:hypothetical protein
MENKENTKFQEICSKFSMAQAEFRNYRMDCNAFAAELWEHIIKYFGIPHSQVAIF